jgi:hypothetical protein
MNDVKMDALNFVGRNLDEAISSLDHITTTLAKRLVLQPFDMEEIEHIKERLEVLRETVEERETR